MKVEVSNSEVCDKFTILVVKEKFGLDVSEEKNVVQQHIDILVNEHPQTVKLLSILQTINEQMWIVEDDKRNCEAERKFDDNFITLSRLVYLLNTQRAQIKRTIDEITNSNIREKKSKNF